MGNDLISLPCDSDMLKQRHLQSISRQNEAGVTLQAEIQSLEFQDMHKWLQEESPKITSGYLMMLQYEGGIAP